LQTTKFLRKNSAIKLGTKVCFYYSNTHEHPPIMTSDVSSVSPSDSVSQAPGLAISTTTAPSRTGGGGRQKRPAKSAIDKTAPPGVVNVPVGGQNASAKRSPVISSTIPISGWGEIDLHDFRKDISPTFTVDANPFDDLVTVTYGSLQSRFSGTGKHIPFALFRYYCFQLWWMRVLHLHKGNANVLSTEEKNALSVFTSGEEFMVPSPIAQYLSNMGNFMQGSESFYFRKSPLKFDGNWENGSVPRGWLAEPDGSIVVASASTFWGYAQLPVPGLFTHAVCAEVERFATPGFRQNLDHVSPVVEGKNVCPSANIIGYDMGRDAHHNSWRSTYTSLGWSASDIPADCQTSFNISTSSMKWMSEKLSSVTGFKLHSSTQLTLSLQGNPIQAYFLGVSHPTECTFPGNSQATVDFRRRGSLNLSLALNSRYGMDSRLLAPSFSFGYRLQRTKHYSKMVDSVVTWYGFSPFDPWYFFGMTGTNAINNPPATFWTAANVPFEFGSCPVLNVERFGTHGLVRSVGLDAALILDQRG
jgi:hypothetical protein